ncbi:rod shape-determining protein RodA [Candidatus Synchoanobacter obligatus]|uniref:Cell wall polymerase n=1 Tax=Candidatus Synchoanobacter obligatus TaxID=2919597 RepID=A0ABT1L4X6_9GAMM|nr:rod shape-determining protein RodA [Candidatus Synchoanobacter obligatus]MCP8351780.1 rod shape-determining protein RodA [Candidatus Synchoanobacter obligatus]
MFSSRQGNIDLTLLGLITIGVFIGIILLFSANHFEWALPLKQLTKGSLAIIFFGALAMTDDRTIRDSSFPLFIFSLILLLIVLYYGDTTKGAQRWLNLGIVKFEPSELVKITLPLSLASHIHKHGIPIQGWPLITAITMLLVPFFLVLKQPDLGTALIILFIGSITLFIAGLSRKIILITIIATFATIPILWHQLHAYQQQRIITLFSENEDLKHHGYHIHQSKIAIGSGGLWGKGYGNGEQVQLGYIPEHKTDFIFTVLSEEFGFFGNIVWLMVILSIGFRSIYLGYKQPQVFNKLVCIALGCGFMLNAWINMAMVSGIIPVVGVPLPLLSYGGTSFVATLVSLSIILKLGHVNPKRQHLW